MLLSGSKYPTSNLFFHGVWAIQHQLQEEAHKDDLFVRAMVSRMQSKFDGYWQDCNLILASAIVFDPRFKMISVDYAYDKVYGTTEGYMKSLLVKDTLSTLFAEYEEQHSSDLDQMSFQVDPHQDSKPSVDISELYTNQCNVMKDFDSYMKKTTLVHKQTELCVYLKKPLCDRKHDLDILQWWKSVEYGYSCLSKLASDVLAIPIISVASESAFSVGGRVLKPSRCFLTPEAVESLICTRNWIFGFKGGSRPS